MIRFFLLACIPFCLSCNTSFITATFGNKNVYKAKSNLTVKKVFDGDRPATDQREFNIVPNPVIPAVTKTTVYISDDPVIGAVPSQRTTTTTITTIPPTTTTTTIVISALPAPVTSKITSSTTTYSLPGPLLTNFFIRYKVISDEGDFKYIKILPGCVFTGAPPVDTSIELGVPAAGALHPENYIFQVSKKNLVPNTHYLASSALIGKVITLPVRIRNEYWNGNNKVLQGALSLGYGFGWKYKVGNNPYKPHYLSTILYAAGISQQKYFSIAGKYVTTNKDSISAKTDEIAITYLSFGFAYEYDKFNIGIFFGKDKMFGNLKNWVYQDKWWWGIGIGYELFK